MTIAACYVSPEGIVLGADSTSTLTHPDGIHFFNHGQKLFQIGVDVSTLGLVTWGMGGLVDKSHRTIVALLADDLAATPPVSVEDVALRFAGLFWKEYQNSPLQPDIHRFQSLAAQNPFDPSTNAPSAGARTEDEEKEFKNLQENLTVGFCIAGYVPLDRVPDAWTILFDPSLHAVPNPQKMQGGPNFWGAPIMILRLLLGYDIRVIQAVIDSGNWSGSASDLEALLGQFVLIHGPLPIRDAIDFVYTSLFSTIKAFKFSSMPQICGGPIEVAVITTDRPFRWVRHKKWDSAIAGGEC